MCKYLEILHTYLFYFHSHKHNAATKRLHCTQHTIIISPHKPFHKLAMYKAERSISRRE